MTATKTYTITEGAASAGRVPGPDAAPGTTGVRLTLTDPTSNTPVAYYEADTAAIAIEAMQSHGYVIVSPQP